MDISSSGRTIFEVGTLLSRYAVLTFLVVPVLVMEQVWRLIGLDAVEEFLAQ